MAENDAESKAGMAGQKTADFWRRWPAADRCGIGAGYLIFGGTQPDPSEEIEKSSSARCRARAAEAEAADNSTPQKMSKDTPEGSVRDHLS